MYTLYTEYRKVYKEWYTLVNWGVLIFLMVYQVQIKISRETKEHLDGLKEHYRETYDDVLRKLINQFFLIQFENEPRRI